MSLYKVADTPFHKNVSTYLHLPDESNESKVTRFGNQKEGKRRELDLDLIKSFLENLHWSCRPQAVSTTKKN